MSAKRKPDDIETRIFGGQGQPLAANGLENDALYKTVGCFSDGWSILRKLPPRPERDPDMTDLRCSVRIYKLMCSKKKLKEETMVQCLERIILEARDVR
jgi:hypothetical protein